MTAASRLDPVRATVGALLVLAGVVALLDRVFDLSLARYGWPLFVIVPGAVLLVAGFTGPDTWSTAALVAGGIVTAVGLLLFYQNATGHWESWAYAWALVAPGSIGAGLWARPRLKGGGGATAGRSLMQVAAVLFLVGFGFFEGVLGISGRDMGRAGDAVLPVLLILLGIALVLRRRRGDAG